VVATLPLSAPPGASARSRAVVKSFPATSSLRVSLTYRRTRRGHGVLLRLAANRLSIYDNGHGRLWASSYGRRLRLLRVSRRRGSVTSLRLRLGSSSDVLSVRIGHSTRRQRLAMGAERRVVVGSRGRVPYRLGNVKVRPGAALRRSATPVARRPGHSAKPPSGGSTPQPHTTPPKPTTPSLPAAPQARPFAANSFWNQPLAPDAALDPLSSAWVADLKRQMLAANPWINTTNYSAPVYTVPAHQTTVRVKLGATDSSLQRAWNAVPLPSNARPASGSDKQLVVWQPSTDTLWEFWVLEKRADGWHAGWGGRMRHVSQNPGYFTEPPRWGATATSLPLLGGLIRINELKAGRIDHGLALAIPDTRAEWFTWPAQRTDGYTRSSTAIPEGARFRIDRRLDLSKLRMDPIVRMIAEAAQRYGIVVRDKAGAVTFYAEDPSPTGTNPYGGPGGLFGEKWIDQLLREQFPWDHLQALEARQRCCWTVG
jgi:hypothetical protein